MTLRKKRRATDDDKNVRIFVHAKDHCDMCGRQGESIGSLLWSAGTPSSSWHGVTFCESCFAEIQREVAEHFVRGIKRQRLN